MQQPAIRWAGLGATLLLLGLAGAPRTAAAQERAAWLGVYTQNIDDDLREGLDYEGQGILVTRVVAESPAARAGVRKGDIIVSLDDRSIDSPAELMSAVRSFRTGQRVALEVHRDGAQRTLRVTLGTRPSDDEAPEAPETPEAPAPPVAPRIERDLMELPEGSWMLPRMGRGRLGVRVETVTPDLADALGTETGGALVVEVLEDTPAQRAGLKAGDVIVRLEDRDVDDTDDLTEALREREAGPLSLTVARRGSTRTLSARLEAAPRSLRFERGPMSLRSGPEARARRITPGTRSSRAERDLEEEIRQLRDEVRKLQEQMESRERD